VVDEDIQRVEGPSEQYEDSWDNQSVGDIELDDVGLGGAEPVRGVVERYRGTAEAEVVKDMREAEGTHSRRRRKYVTERVSAAVPLGRQNNGSRRGGAQLTWEEDLGETPTVGALGRGRFCVDSESRGGGGGI
jgi:hypothetical protein